MSKLSRNRRTLLSAALATAGLAAHRREIVGKKKKKKCKAPTTRCDKKRCCQPGQTCVSGQCQAASTTSTTTPTPLTEVGCGPFSDLGWPFSRRVAQPFVANGAGKIASASFRVNGSSPNRPFSVEIRTTNSGVPTTEVLGTTFVIDLPVVSPSTEYNVIATFDPKVPVQQGVTYALVVTDVANQGVSFPVQFLGSCPLRAFADNAATNNFTQIEDRNLIFAISPG
ncbi:MAG: hypothetical protein KC442_13375 [Thermomicrobiales bacterium]|nr:hypothetical protein [Thermomicrobiales bacterium]